MKPALFLVAVAGCAGGSPYVLSGAATVSQAISVQAQATAPPAAAAPAPGPQPVAQPPWPEAFEPPADSPARAACAESLYPYRQKRALLRIQNNFQDATFNEADMVSEWSRCEADFYRRRQEEASAREYAEEERRRVALAVAERERTAMAEEARRRETAESTAEPVAQPTATEEPPTPPPPPRKLTAGEKKRATERRAERERKAAEVQASVDQFKIEYCGPAPERSKWDGIYVGLERAYKTVANDPDSIDFVGCTDADLRNPPACWVFTCDLRGKNVYGAKVLVSRRFRKTAKGYYLR